MRWSSPWLGDSRGYAVDWATQRWVRLTGCLLDLREHPWLAGPIGDRRRIGGDYFERLSAEEGLRLRHADSAMGLMVSFGALAGSGFDPREVHPAVRAFYERTSEYTLDVWSEWAASFRPFGQLLGALFSRRLEQLNVPLSPLSTTRGMTSSIVRLEDPRSGTLRHTGWIRENRALGVVVYVGVYSVARIPGHGAPCIKVAFPLPNGSATVFMKARAETGGALVLESLGDGFGDPGFYFVVRKSRDFAWVRYVRTFRESIRVYVEPPDQLRTDHLFTLWSRPYLRLHYHMRQQGPGHDRRCEG